MIESTSSKYQSLFWRGEQVFFPVSSLEDIEVFLRFIRVCAVSDFDGVVGFASEYDIMDKPYTKHYLSALSPVAEDDADFSVRKHDLIVASSELGYPPAEFTRYKYLHDGDYGFDKNKDEALVWLIRAAKHGHCDAMHLYSEYLKATEEDTVLGREYAYVSEYLKNLRDRSADSILPQL